MEKKVEPMAGKKKQKVKMKKDAFLPVDREKERQMDPKYKTELCKTWIENGFCPYGNACRFAHGKDDLYEKARNSTYKSKICKAFHQRGYCPYGNRCGYIHDERKLKDIFFPYYYVTLFVRHQIVPLKRLKIFEELTKDQSKDIFSSSDSSQSTEEARTYYRNSSQIIKNNHSSNTMLAYA
ncbi:MAG: hypothetical protein MJ252_05705 [archaeon]|nr:hypothetical protein [archaeon]